MEILVFLGFGVMIVGGIMFLIETFKESVLWGLGSLLVPFVSLFFLIMHWDVAKKPFLVQIVGVVICFVAGGFAPDSAIGGVSP